MGALYHNIEVDIYIFLFLYIYTSTLYLYPCVGISGFFSKDETSCSFVCMTLTLVSVSHLIKSQFKMPCPWNHWLTEIRDEILLTEIAVWSFCCLKLVPHMHVESGPLTERAQSSHRGRPSGMGQEEEGTGWVQGCAAPHGGTPPWGLSNPYSET